MKKTWIALPVAAMMALGMVACSDAGTFMAPEGLDIKAAEPKTEVTMTVQIAAPETVEYTFNNKNPNQGYCAEEANPDGGTWGVWYQPAGITGFNAHAGHINCNDIVRTGDGTVPVDFKVVATYVGPTRAGNFHLNFSACGYTEDEEGNWEPVACEGDNYIHYQANRNLTRGEGAIWAVDENGVIWTILLSQFTNDPDDGDVGLAAREILVSSITSSEVPAKVTTGELTW
jgi:hypothetical protein